MANSKNSSYTRVTEIRFKPVTHRPAKGCQHVSFVVDDGLGGKVATSESAPTDQQIFDMLTKMGRIEPHPGSSRRDTPGFVVLTGIEYDLVCDEELNFAFSDGAESPIRWPHLVGRISRDELTDWLVNEYEEAGLAVAAK